MMIFSSNLSNRTLVLDFLKQIQVGILFKSSFRFIICNKHKNRSWLYDCIMMDYKVIVEIKCIITDCGELQL